MYLSRYLLAIKIHHRGIHLEVVFFQHNLFCALMFRLHVWTFSWNDGIKLTLALVSGEELCFICCFILCSIKYIQVARGVEPLLWFWDAGAGCEGKFD